MGDKPLELIFRILTFGLAQSAKKPTGDDTVC
jgi:hypothetical protein